MDNLLKESDRLEGDDLADHLYDAAGLLAAGHKRSDVSKWTGLNCKQLTTAATLKAEPIPSPAEIERLAEAIRSGETVVSLTPSYPEALVVALPKNCNAYGPRWRRHLPCWSGAESSPLSCEYCAPR